MNSLVIDFTVDKIIKEIISELKIEKGIILDYDVIKSVIEQQEISTANAIENGENLIVRKYFGKFILKPIRVKHLNNTFLKHNLIIDLEDRGLYTFIVKDNKFIFTLVSDLNYIRNVNF